MPRLPQSEEQRDNVRRRILDAAQDLFDSAGIDAVSMRALGARVGLTASALYAYFPTKTTLLRALWWDALDELLSRMQDISRNETDPISAIRALGRTYSEFALENPARYRVLFLIEAGETVADLRTQGFRHKSYDILYERIDDAIKSHQLKDGDPHTISQVFWAGVHGVIMLASSATSFPTLPPDAFVSAMLDALLSGLCAPSMKK